jgi:hypothetical protein
VPYYLALAVFLIGHEAHFQNVRGETTGKPVGASYGAETMPTLYRVVAPDGNLLGEGISIDEVVEIVKKAAPGRYRVDLVKSGVDPAPESSRFWGEVIKTVRGRIKLNAPPWAD